MDKYEDKWANEKFLGTKMTKRSAWNSVVEYTLFIIIFILVGLTYWLSAWMGIDVSNPARNIP